MKRRNFLQSGAINLASMATLTSTALLSESFKPVHNRVDRIKLGNSGLKVSRMAFGTGTIGSGHQSNQTRLGRANFVKLAHHAFDRGITFFDCADSYGSYPFVAELFKEIPRNRATLLGKMSTSADPARYEPVERTLNRFCKEAGTDYFDILLIHCMTSGTWTTDRRRYMDELTKAKQQGIIRAVGVSCHSLEALKSAAEEPWVEVILARINPFQSHMDGTPAQIVEVLELARKNGKGIIGMKIFGEGSRVKEQEREESLSYAFTKSPVHGITLGFESIAQVDDAVDRVNRILRG